MTVSSDQDLVEANYWYGSPILNGSYSLGNSANVLSEYTHFTFLESVDITSFYISDAN